MLPFKWVFLIIIRISLLYCSDLSSWNIILNITVLTTFLLFTYSLMLFPNYWCLKTSWKKYTREHYSCFFPFLGRVNKIKVMPIIRSYFFCYKINWIKIFLILIIPVFFPMCLDTRVLVTSCLKIPIHLFKLFQTKP